MYGYIYWTINLINGKQYIGKREKGRFDKNYYGSGKHLRYALKKYGKENFSVHIIDVAETKEELCEKEIYWIAKYDATNSPIFYNIAKGGQGGGTNKGEKGRHWYNNGVESVQSFECPEGYVPGRLMTDALYKSMHAPMSEEAKKKSSQSKIGHPCYIQKMPEEAKKKISDSLKGKPKNYKTAGWEKGHSPWNKGVKDCFSEETKKRISDSLKDYYANRT